MQILLRNVYADYAIITQINYAELRNEITQINYAYFARLRNKITQDYAIGDLLMLMALRDDQRRLTGPVASAIQTVTILVTILLNTCEK
jgi:uncharacterized protein with HEPN domain